MNKNDKRYNLTIDLTGSDELNEAIDKLIEERVKSITRSDSDSRINEIIEEVAEPRIKSYFNDKDFNHKPIFVKLIENEVRGTVREMLGYRGGYYLTMTDAVKSILREELEHLLKSKTVKEIIDQSIKEAVSSKLGKDINPVVINAVIQALTDNK